MTWRWMCLKAKGSVPMGFSELPAGRSCLALGWSCHTVASCLLCPLRNNCSDAKA